jgi:DNA-directed RNA polymerase sigma subunit (sigma70/sigma32)
MSNDEKKLVEKYKTKKSHLGHLQPRYLEVFEYRTGIADGARHTQKETGKKFGVSSTRAAQLEARVKYEIEQL